MDADIVCVGFGPAAGGFLTQLAAAAINPDGSPALESPSMPGMPLQVMCYERADDIGFGVSGVVTNATSLRAILPRPRPRANPDGRPGQRRKKSSICWIPPGPAGAR